MFSSVKNNCDFMEAKRKPRRKPRKIFKTVIKLTPSKDGKKATGEPEIEIDTVTLRPKLIQLKPKQKKQSSSSGTFMKNRKIHAIDAQHKLRVAERFDEGLIQRMEWVPVTNKTRWKCIRCGWCCSHEWRVNLTWPEYDRLKDKLPIDEMILDEKTGMSHPFYMIKNRCVQYNPKKHGCKIYKKRAYSCATYPFALTPEGKLVRSKFCKGFGKGAKIDQRKMKRYIYKWRKRAGMMVL